jgi:hypothetical protein
LAATGEGTIEQGIERLNGYRMLAGLSPVAEDATVSASCFGHLQYLVEEVALTSGASCLLSHDESDHSNPFYSPQNEQAGLGALIACIPPASGGLHLTRALDRWIGSLYHRIPLLSPGLLSVGVAEWGGYVCLNYQQGTAPLAEIRLVTWPADGMTDVPTDFPGRESPCPSAPWDPVGTGAEQCPTSGFILTATWFGPPGSGVFSGINGASATDSATGSTIELLATYGDGIGGSDPVPGVIPRTIALVPTASLPASTRISVGLVSVLDGVERAAGWQFDTGTRKE